MAFNGSGTFLINTAGQPVVSGTVISSTAFNALTADLATGLSTAITKDGQTTVTANIPMSTYKFTGLGVGSAATDSANLSQVQSTVTKLLTSVSGTDTITAVGAPVVAAYAAGQMFYFVATGDNTGAVTLNIDSLGAKAVTRDGSVALAAGDIKSGEVVVVVYDGTRFQVVSQLNSAGNATFANVSITSALNVGGVVTLSGGTANGVLYLNGSKVATSGSALTFDGTNLGLGVLNTNALLTVAGDKTQIRVERGSAIGFLYNTGTASTDQLRLQSNAGPIDIYTASGQPIIFSAGAAEQMRLTSTGLGIGTSSPAYKLQVSANANSDTTINASNTTDGTSSAARFLAISNAGSVWFGMTAPSYNAVTGASDACLINTGNASNGICFANDGVLQMKLDSSGNLGLGVTPSAWQTFTSALEVPGGALAGISANQVGIWQNCFYNSSSFKYKSTAAATLYQQAGAVHAWYNAASGTAGNTISFTQAMTLSAAGNLLVGCTAVPSASVEGFCVTGTSSGNLSSSGASTSAYNHFLFLNGNGTVGSISTSSSTTTYSTSSDRRLKDNIVSADDAGSVIDAIEVVKHDWKVGGHTRYGMIAQDLHMVAPEAVSVGDADNVEDFKNPWGVDYSKLVPMLVKEIQSLRARVAQLESK
jgi:hypothetical protein